MGVSPRQRIEKRRNMRLEEACSRFNRLARIRFGDLFSPSDMNMIIINKGKTGQLLELSLGMNLSSTNLDFDDGELKTNRECIINCVSKTSAV